MPVGDSKASHGARASLRCAYGACAMRWRPRRPSVLPVRRRCWPERVQDRRVRELAQVQVQVQALEAAAPMQVLAPGRGAAAVVGEVPPP